MNPQQRLLYQAAYQAVAQSGYFQYLIFAKRGKRFGCYIGVCYNDYENNVSHCALNVLSVTGNLRGFVAMRISYYFGWKCPGLVLNAMSLSNLYDAALEKAGMAADQVSVVEAHGTGTPVGVLAEYESIRQV
ncbi:hypothetical protein HD806DRAFT_545156 [Xylariaceae sp. AK1471]|nr:hypothetical protein HD806DRAFT_545156 [Xylariaceae sp. AK1471]